MTECSSVSDSTVRSISAITRPAPRRPWRVDPRLLIAAAVIVLIAAGEGWVVLHGAAGLNPLALDYVP